MQEDFTTKQLESLNRADNLLNLANVNFELATSAIQLAVCNLRRGQFNTAYRLHGVAIMRRKLARYQVEEASRMVRAVLNETGQSEHCHLAYRRNRINHAPARKILAQWCTMAYASAGTIAVMTILFLIYMWRVGLL